MIGGLEEQPCNTGTILQASANKILASTILAHCYNLGGRAERCWQSRRPPSCTLFGANGKWP